MKRESVDIKKFHKVMFLYNSKAGKQFLTNTEGTVGEIANTLRHVWEKGVFEDYRIENFDQVAELAGKAAELHADWVIVAGGDGTLRALVETFVELDFRPYISIFPGGTVNLVAKELEQKKDVTRWLRRVQRGIVNPVWLGRANDRIFLTVAGIGVDSLVVDGVSEKDKKFLSKLAYAKQGGKLITKELLTRDWRYRFKVMIDESGEWQDASSVIVSKSRYYAGRFSLVDGASLQAPRLHVCLFTGRKKVDFLRYVALIAADMLNLDKSVKIIDAQKVQIISNVESFAAELDGDSLVTSPLDISLLDKPMRFIS